MVEQLDVRDVICGVLTAFIFVLVRWKDLMSFSPELRFEGYHRFAGTLLSPAPVTGSDLIMLRVRAEDGESLTLPALKDVSGEGRPLASYPVGTCVEGWVRHRKGFISEVRITVDGTDYYQDKDIGWIVRKTQE